MLVILCGISNINNINKKFNIVMEENENLKKEIQVTRNVINNLESYLPGIGISDAVNEIIQASLKDSDINTSKLTKAMMTEKNRVMLELHGLQNYNLRYENIIFPVRYPEKTYVSCPEAEFGLRKLSWHKYKDFHNGLDLFPIDDTDVIAAGDGYVVWVGESIVGGKAVIIQHFTSEGIPFYSYVGHLYSYSVKKDQHVKRGEVIGIVGETGTEISGRHIHFEIREYINLNDVRRVIAINPVTNSTWCKRVEEKNLLNN
jgi:murein DD-endopeptidase MepM/ murein hydrolase activator NlpD